VLALLVASRDRAIPLPAAVALLSPWTDLALRGFDPLERIGAARCSSARTSPAGRRYLGGEDPRNPLASPLYADLLSYLRCSYMWEAMRCC